MFRPRELSFTPYTPHTLTFIAILFLRVTQAYDTFTIGIFSN